VARPHFSLHDRGSRWLMVMGRLKPGRPCLSASECRAIAVTWNRNTRKPTNRSALRLLVLQSPFSLKQTCGQRWRFNGCSRRGAPDRLRQCCEPPVGARCLTAQGDRAASGARRSRGRLVRQMLTESFVLASLGAAWASWRKPDPAWRRAARPAEKKRRMTVSRE